MFCVSGPSRTPIRCIGCRVSLISFWAIVDGLPANALLLLNVWPTGLFVRAAMAPLTYAGASAGASGAAIRWLS